MTTPWRLVTLLFLSVAVVAGITLAFAQTTVSDLANLPKPVTTGGKPLMQALKARHSTRSFAPRELAPQTISNLLWAAFGVNRPDTGQRTAPSAVNWQEIDLYLAMRTGLFLFDARTHSLKQVLTDDLRPNVGLQPYVATAPIVLVYVADLSRMTDASPEDKTFYSAADTGFIAQNVYLFAASEDLATVVVGLIDRPALAAKMKLRPDQKIILAQPVGYPGN